MFQKIEKLATLTLSSKTSRKLESPPSLGPPAKKARVDKKHNMLDDANKGNQSPANFSDTKGAVKFMFS